MDWMNFLMEPQSLTIIGIAIPFLFGGGVIGKLVSEGIRKYGFDIMMDDLNSQNEELLKKQGTYVSRRELESEIDSFINSNHNYCEIIGAAGSGKTRLALNIIKKNKLLSPYFYVFINKNNAFILDKEIQSIYGKRKYVFIFDYVYENKERIRKILKLASQTNRHKFIFIERDYTGLQLKCDHKILMENYSMSVKDLVKIYLNELCIASPKNNMSEEEASKIIEKAYDKLDKQRIRPIIAKLLADIYDIGTDNQKDIENMQDLIQLYWKYKFDNLHIEDIVSKYKLNADDIFMQNLDILVRSLLIIAAVTKRSILVKCIDGKVLYKIEGHDTDIVNLVNGFCGDSFSKEIGRLPIECLIELFGGLLKEQLVTDRNNYRDSFTIVSDLDIVSEWLLYDILSQLKNQQVSLHNTTIFWGDSLRLFLETAFPDDYIRFMARAATDFSDMIEYYGYTLSDDIDLNEYILHVTYLLSTLYNAPDSKNRDKTLERLKNYLDSVAKNEKAEIDYTDFQIFAWENLLSLARKKSDAEQLTNDIEMIYQKAFGDV